MECPPTPHKSLTSFSEVPDRPTPEPGCEVQQVLTCCVGHPEPPLLAGCKDNPAQGVAAIGSVGRRVGPCEIIAASEASAFLHPMSPRRSCSGPGFTKLPESLGKEHNLLGLPPGPCQ